MGRTNRMGEEMMINTRFTKLVGLSLTLAALPHTAHADGLKDGWRLSSFGDPFTKKVQVIASVAETATKDVNLDEAKLAFTCTKAAFQSGRLNFGNKAESVMFRIGDEVVEATFEPSETEFGILLISNEAIAEKLRTALLAGSDIGFQTSDKTGEFSAIGASRILPALDATCKAQ